jgi:hypothetical protein
MNEFVNPVFASCVTIAIVIALLLCLLVILGSLVVLFGSKVVGY